MKRPCEPRSRASLRRRSSTAPRGPMSTGPRSRRRPRPRSTAPAPGTSRASAEVGARVVHVSSDYVFSGDSAVPYLESDEVAPRSAYGRSKLAGEQAVAVGSADHAIARTAWLFGSGGRNFVDTMLTL